MRHRRHLRAPYDLLAKDFRAMEAAETLRTTWDTERLIFIQSVQGHAHEGHSTFAGMRYPNTTIDDIARALRLDTKVIRQERQDLIDEIGDYAARVISGENPTLSNREGRPILRSSMFHSLPISGHDVLRGLYMGGLRDDACVRFQAEELYGFTIGGGKCYLVDTKIMDRLGLNGEILAHGSHEDMIDYYYQEGLIVAEEGVDKGDLEYMYIRFRRGTGASDDTAIVASGLLYGIGTAIGVFLADAIDTLEKHVPVFSDQDDSLAKRIKRDYAKLDVSEAEVRRLIYLSALPEDTCINVPDSSLRRLILIDRSFDLTAVESHLLFVQGKNYAPIRIGHEDIPNERFYTYVEDKISHSPGVR